MTAPDPRETIRQEWSAAAPFWKKWHAQLSHQSRRATELVVHGAQLSSGHHVLDLASGTGEPSLSVAGAVGPDGRVFATDLVREMLHVAEEFAAARGFRNIEFHSADAEQLPFPDRHFDRVTCRFGLMFVPDTQKALREMRRVLKPGGRVSFVTWGPSDENPLFATMLRPFLKYVEVPRPDPDAPHVFRFANEAKLGRALADAGFREVAAAKHKIDWPWPGTPEEAWQGGSELAAPFKKIIAATPPDKREEAVQEAIAGIRAFYNGTAVVFPATVNSATASTPLES
ncbi:MAG TPA: class I SAM-dependent methyltransferase [Candidatus Eisenbacteria bacterium]|nr:class I SAM-dependent methyltransferase [Candidatus Eisenbacteria bacterium]